MNKASDLAFEQENDALYAIIRVNLGYLSSPGGRRRLLKTITIEVTQLNSLELGVQTFRFEYSLESKPKGLDSTELRILFNGQRLLVN